MHNKVGQQQKFKKKLKKGADNFCCIAANWIFTIGFWMANHSSNSNSNLSISEERHYYKMRLHLPYPLALQKAHAKVLSLQPQQHEESHVSSLCTAHESQSQRAANPAVEQQSR
ncbi:hypothetical protein ACA910_008243 [Epithemia clementina (nom. ined.)]